MSLWQCKKCGLFNYPVETECKACFSTKLLSTNNNNGYYRVNTKSNKIKLDINEILHQFDPLGDLSKVLQETVLIKNCGIHPSFIIKEIVQYHGYIESTLNKKSWNCFYSSETDIEQCYFITLPPRSTYSYILKSFTCNIRSTSKKTIYHATLVVFDEHNIENNTEEILFQSKWPYDKNMIIEVSDEVSSTPIIKFNMNIKLQNDKVYLLRIDVPQGQICCDYVDESKEDKVCMVDTRGRYCDHEYYFRTYCGHENNGKLYEMVLM